MIYNIDRRNLIIKFKQNNFITMGNSSHSIDPSLQFYLSAEHPIEGEVKVYTLPGEGVYIMKKPTHI